MSTKKRTPATTAKQSAQPPFDVAAYDALTDEDIAAQIAANPDAAPEWDWPLDDPQVVVMVPFDVQAIRARVGMSQEEFAREFGFNLALLRDWEGQRRVPRGPALTLLRVIGREPAAVRRALAQA